MSKIISIVMMLFTGTACLASEAEQKLLQKHKDKVERQGDTLLLKVKGKVFKTLKDVPVEAEAKSVSYEVVRVDDKQHIVLTRNHLYEGVSYYLFSSET